MHNVAGTRCHDAGKNEAFIAAAQPTAILSLLAERDALVRVAEAAKTHRAQTRPDFVGAGRQPIALAALAAIQEKPDAP